MTRTQAMQNIGKRVVLTDGVKYRLIRPGVALHVDPKADDGHSHGNGGGGGGDDGDDIDPIIEGLLKRLPKSGAVWPEPQRELWLDLLKGSFKLIYKDKPESEPVPATSGTETKNPW